MLPNLSMILVIILLPEFLFYYYYLKIVSHFAWKLFLFLLNKMLGPVLKDVEPKHNRINKWLFIYKQWELLMVTGRKLKSEMINSGCGTVSGHVFCTALNFKRKQIAYTESI